MNTGSSPYHAIKALYCRGPSGDLLSIEGVASNSIRNHWHGVQDLVRTTPEISVAQLSVTTTDVSRAINSTICADAASHSHFARELYRPDGDYHVGLISCILNGDLGVEDPFRDWLHKFILSETSLKPSEQCPRHLEAKSAQTTECITSLFATALKNVASNDEWEIGMPLFKRQVQDFVVRNERIQMSLPAFPCKSGNVRKVGGSGPDMAERIALRTLQSFAKDVRQLYPPGVTIWIVSDGYVFSDCIGVGDNVVSRYDRDMLRLSRDMCGADDKETIKFRGLTEMFFRNTQCNFDEAWLEDFKLEHPILSQHEPYAELARSIMMAGFQSSREHFRKLVTEQHPPTLSLYRGQARFMQNDLASPEFLAKSAKQKKKISFLVATEMILRNQAYSNLLELLLPNYVRLSIHAHINRGPKFGICLLPRDQVRAIDSVVDRHALFPSYEFQVPTPWHNSIINIEGDSKIYLGKAEIVYKAISDGEFEGGWAEDSVEGGHFAIRPVMAVCETPPTTQASSIMSVTLDEKQAAMTCNEDVEVVVLDAPTNRKAHLTLTIRGKVYSISQLSRFLTKLVTRNSPRKADGHGTAVARS